MFSDEPEVPETGDGTVCHAPDFKDEYDDGRGLLVRAERQGPGDGGGLGSIHRDPYIRGPATVAQHPPENHALGHGTGLLPPLKTLSLGQFNPVAHSRVRDALHNRPDRHQRLDTRDLDHAALLFVASDDLAGAVADDRAL